ncbi:MAG TPA: efflux RND transporter periplasmic adaptor subunit [Gemmatimonadota bacterium]
MTARRGPLLIQALAATSGVWLAACSDGPAPAPPPVPVTVAAVERRDMPFELEAAGTVEPMQSVAVRAQVAGVLDSVGFHEGDLVRKDQVLFLIDPRPYRAALRQAQAALARDRAQAENARQNLERYRELAAKDYVTAQQLDEARATVAALEATVAGDEAGVEKANLDLQYATLRSPIDGRAGNLLVRPGNLVSADGQTPLVTVNQIDPILVRFALPATDLARVREHAGPDVVVQAVPQGAPGPPLDGTLSFVDNAVDSLTGTILLKGRFANPEGLLWPGQLVHVAVRLFVERAATVVPAAAVVAGQEGSYVFVVGPEDKADLRPVQVERVANNVAVVGKGVEPGERVVTDGQLRLRPGARVTIKPPPTLQPESG